MKLRICTICLDAMPFLAYHLPVFNRLPFDWQWVIAEGTSKPVNDTAWVKGIKPRLSLDGTTQYLDSIASHPRVKIFRKEEWNGKTEQINACCQGVQEGDVVMQIDSDEIWSARQIELIVRLLTTGQAGNGMSFWCRYFVGLDIVVTTRNCYSQHKDWEWRRAWLGCPGFAFTKHEPPETNASTNYQSNDSNEALGLVFDHYAYALESQVAFKSVYYGKEYKDAVAQWKRLQSNTTWPAKLANFFPWVKDDTMVDRIRL